MWQPLQIVYTLVNGRLQPSTYRIPCFVRVSTMCNLLKRGFSPSCGFLSPHARLIYILLRSLTSAAHRFALSIVPPSGDYDVKEMFN